jgi:ribonuclease HII
MARQLVPSTGLEESLYDQGVRIVAGVDEVGRGAWAGPLVASAAVFATGQRVLHLRDSKLLTRDKRELLARRLKRLLLGWSIGTVEIEELNAIGLAAALSRCVERAVAGLPVRPDRVLIDGNIAYESIPCPQQAIVQGDQRIRCIAAASVLAKVARDQMMRTLHRQESGVRRFRFDQNKGYPSPLHREQLERYGPTANHRITFTPIRRLLSGPSAS